MSIEDLLEQMERYRFRREQRDYRPEWLKSFIRMAASLFEPLSHLGRVGYDCQCDERCWTVCMYLGTTEIVGGARDGQIDHADFRIDLVQLPRLFHRVTRMEWYSLTGDAPVPTVSRVRSVVAVHGTVLAHEPLAEQDVRLELLALPPDFVGPGLHCRPDGMIYETT
jgi:hypothetical protein